MKNIKYILIGLFFTPILAFGAWSMSSIQIGSSPTNGDVLQTDGINSTWVATSTLGLGGGGSGTVTSVDMSVPTGFSLSGNPITTAGTLDLSFLTGYSLPLTASTTEGSTAFTWGDHALAGYSSFSFTPTTNYGSLTNATNTPIWFQSGLQASSTSHFSYASTTLITSTGGMYLGNGLDTIQPIITVNNASIPHPYIEYDNNFLGSNFAGASWVSAFGKSAFASRSDTDEASMVSWSKGLDKETQFLLLNTTDLTDGGAWMLNKRADEDNRFSIEFNDYATPANNLEVFSITTNGNVGISTTSPYAKLSVVGNIVASDITATSTATIPSNGTVDANGEITLDDTTGQLRGFAGGSERVYSPFFTTGFTYSTSSSWTTGTTTKPYLAPAVANLTLTTAFCETDTGTLNVSVRDGAGNRLDLINASTTIGTFTFSTNNTFTIGESIRVEVGTPASSPTLISCRFKGTYTAD